MKRTYKAEKGESHKKNEVSAKTLKRNGGMKKKGEKKKKERAVQRLN